MRRGGACWRRVWWLPCWPSFSSCSCAAPPPRSSTALVCAGMVVAEVDHSLCLNFSAAGSRGGPGLHGLPVVRGAVDANVVRARHCLQYKVAKDNYSAVAGGHLALEGNNVKLYLGASISATVLAVLFVILLLFLRNRIRLVVGIFEEVNSSHATGTVMCNALDSGSLSAVVVLTCAFAGQSGDVVDAAAVRAAHCDHGGADAVLCVLAHCLPVPRHMRHADW